MGAVWACILLMDFLPDISRNEYSKLEIRAHSLYFSCFPHATYAHEASLVQASSAAALAKFPGMGGIEYDTIEIAMVYWSDPTTPLPNGSIYKPRYACKIGHHMDTGVGADPESQRKEMTVGVHLRLSVPDCSDSSGYT